MTTKAASNAGRLLRDWPQRRRLSQLALAVEADVSSRHLSFAETGRARPSRGLLLDLPDHLDVPPELLIEAFFPADAVTATLLTAAWSSALTTSNDA